ncbi:MAG: hypothetical protein M3068_09780 [Gemmatimonadota bacterium]|nr:hypothetical protein [Gemmatimonadota bacterium]
MRTAGSPAVVLAAARNFFAGRNPIYAAFLEKEGPNYVAFRGQGGEEIVIAAEEVAGGSAVRGSTYLFSQQLQRFFSTLDPLPQDQGVGS